MKEAVEQCGADDGIAENNKKHLAPFCKSPRLGVRIMAPRS